MNVELKRIEKKIKDCLTQAGLEISPIIFFGYENDGVNDQVKYVIYENSRWSLVYYERGRSKFLITSDDMNDVVFRILLDSAKVAANKYCDRKNDVDIRRCQFKKTIEILQRVEVKWVERARNDFVDILKRHPYDDDVSQRLDLLRSLKLKGLTHEEAMKLSEEKYPKPKPEKNPEI